jgi:hypothetical protein
VPLEENNEWCVTKVVVKLVKRKLEIFFGDEFMTVNLFKINSTIFITCCLFSKPLLSQTIWVNQGTGKALAVEFLKPSFEGDINTTFTTSAVFLSGRFQISPDIVVVAELPSPTSIAVSAQRRNSRFGRFCLRPAFGRDFELKLINGPV